MSGGNENGRPAVFLDRDGTLIENVDYLADPSHIRLFPGTAEALRRLRQAGYARVIISNQSGIGRGLLTHERVQEIHDELERQLAESDAGLDAIYYCPAVPTIDDPTQVEHPDRKPGHGLLVRAAEELGLDLSGSWMIGDMISDALAGRNAGCRGSILVRTGKPCPPGTEDVAATFPCCDDILAAVDLILSGIEGTSAARRS
jgi:D-glycero-D-manno-heptose 1,7-bisphosphate phosphatase